MFQYYYISVRDPISRDPISELRHETITFDWFFSFGQLPPVFEFQYSYYVYMLQEKRV